MRIDTHAIPFVYETAYLDSRYRCHTCQQQRCVNAEIPSAYFVGDDTVKFTLQVVLRLPDVGCSQPGSTTDRLRKPLAVNLMVIVQWNLIYLHHHLGHHVHGLLLCHMVFDGFTVEFAFSGDIRHDICAVQRVAGRLHRHACHTWTGLYDGLHLAQLYAETAYLDQSVAPSGKQQGAVCASAHEVACAEQAFVVFRMGIIKGVVDKGVGR